MGQTHDRFVALDGLRGMAAMAVVILHNRAAFGGDRVFGHAYLAVDLFFILSGFVLAQAYRDRLTDWPAAGRFLVRRAIRLLPLLALGALLGALTAPVGTAGGSQGLATLANAIGLPAWWRADPFAVNPPAWSLFWELAACVAFAAVGALRIRLPALPVIGAMGGVMIGVAILAHHIDVGLATAPGGLLLGGPRIALGFMIGVAISRSALAERAFARAPRPWLGLLLVASLTLLPNRTPWATLYDPLAAYLLFPLLIAAGARTICLWPRFASLIGAVSYPLYILHHPLIRLMDRAAAAATGATPGQPLQIAIVLSTVPLSYLALRCYDEPVRAWLATAAGRPRRGGGASVPLSA